MTRDEAIKDFGACIWPGSTTGPDLAVRYIDWFAKNGMLKLDEPPQKYSGRALAAVKECRSAYTETVEFLDALAARGFSFIEK